MSDPNTPVPGLRRAAPALLVLAVVTACTTALLTTRAMAHSTEAAKTPAHTAHVIPGAARTSLPGLSPATGAPDLPSLHTAIPPAGTVVQAPGPFDDRLSVSDLSFNGTRLTGAATVTSDVSDVLEFEALAGFYDSRGRLVGTGRFTYHHTEDAASAEHAGPPNELQRFTIGVPRGVRTQVVSAAVGIPVLVNE